MLEIRVLGGLEVIRDGAPATLPPSRKTRALLAYLALTGRPHRREQLCEMFWDVPDDPRGALRWSLSKIRPLVDDPAYPRLVTDRQDVELRSEPPAPVLGSLGIKGNQCPWVGRLIFSRREARSMRELRAIGGTNADF